MTDADLYERFVQGLYYQYLLPGDGLGTKYTLHHRKSYIGLKTGNTHEVDLSFEANIGSMRFLILIECKYYRRRVGKEIVEELHARIDDIGAHKGAIVTTVGFQKGALNAAKAYGIALIIATVSSDWFENPDPSCLLDPQWKFMNHGYIPVPFFGPWPMGCAHHGRYQEAANDYVQDGIRLLELSKKAYFLYKQQDSSEKRKLLNFVCSNSIWKDHTLTATFRQPFDLLAITNTTWQRKKAAGADSSDLRPIWLRR